MNIRSGLSAVLFGFAVASFTCPASAQELRERHARVALNVPDAWNVSVDGDEAVAAPPDDSFHLRVIGTDRGHMEERNAEEYLMGMLNRHFDDARVTRHGHHVEWNDYEGVEVFGVGHEKNERHTQGKFFLVVLTDKHNPHRGVVAIGTGTDAGFDRHHPGIYEALHSLRAY